MSDEWKPTEEQTRAMIAVVRPLVLEISQKYNQLVTQALEDAKINDVDQSYIVTERLTVAFLAEVVASLFSSPLGCHLAVVEHMKKGGGAADVYDLAKKGPRIGLRVLDKQIRPIFLTAIQVLETYDAGFSDAVDEIKVERGVSKDAVDDLMAKVMAKGPSK
jgi:hypothetical protein